MLNLTRENVSEALLAVINQEGRNKVYLPPDGLGTDCVYFCRGNDGLEPSCLWGHVLLRLGMTYDELETHSTSSIRTLMLAIGVTDQGLMAAASKSQAFQDTGSTWIVCFQTFISSLADRPIELSK